MKKIYGLLFEKDETEIKDPPEGNVSFKGRSGSRRSSDSVDDQIDSLILMYEKNAIKDDDKSLFELFSRGSLKMLLEQEDGEGEGEGEGESAATDDTETTSAAPEGSEAPSDVPAADKDIVPNLNIDDFTEKVARLILNHRNLLRIEDVIINRAKNFLDENYGDAFVSRYLSDLESHYGIEVSIFPRDELEDDVPFAVGANPAGAGMSGGG